MTPEQLSEIRKRADAASAGPWKAKHRCMGCTADEDETCGLGLDVDGPPEAMNRGQFERGADATFIAHSREDIPSLLDEVERLRGLVEVYRGKRR